MNKDYYYLEEYHQNGGTYVLPVEIVNDLLGDIEQATKQNEKLKQKLNWIAFGDDPELALRFLRKIGYVDFDEERKVYINKHNNEPFCLDDEEEKDYYIKDEDLNEYTQQLEYKLKQRDLLIECLYKDVTLNEKQEELLNKILFDNCKGGKNE